MSFRSRRGGKPYPITPRSYRKHGTGKRQTYTRLPSEGIRHEGALTKQGYNEEEGESARREALRKAVRADGYAKTVERVNELAVLNKHHPEKHEKLENDLHYLHTEYRD